MRNRLPPLEALRYFECAARHLNFTLAAKELCVSQSAVSQKIIQLEERLGYKVFERKPRLLRLTESGEQLFQTVHHSLNQIRNTINSLETHQEIHRLDVYCMPAFASRWLMPYINNFHQANPKIDLNLVAQFAEPNFSSKEVDVGICHGIGFQNTLEQQLLFRDYIYPVASPDLLEKVSLKVPEDLSKTILLHDSLPHAKLSSSWSSWLTEFNVKGIDHNAGNKFNQADLIVQAAIDGQGVALGRHALVAREIAKGRLIPLFNKFTESESVYLVYPKASLERPQVLHFINWVKEQAQRFDGQHNINKILRKFS